jgi:hypothetical protein
MVVVACALLSGVAQAEDNANWSGWRVGAFGGNLWGKVNSNDPTHEQTTGDYKDDGGIAGVYGGWRHQNAKNLVVGLELNVPFYVFTGSAVDTVYFPGLVKYEAKSKAGAFLGVNVGKAMGKALPYLHGAIGFARIDGRTLNVDDNDAYSPGFVQSATATHLMWQAGGGLDYQLGAKWLAGVRVVAFIGDRADHTMSWNEPGPNEFGYKATLLQFNVGYRL